MTEPDWSLMVAIMKFLESHWQEPDEGIWEVRGGSPAVYPLKNDGLAGIRSRDQVG